MLISMGILVVSAGILFIVLPSLYKKQNSKELWTFSILQLTGTSLAIAMAFQVRLPNPINGISFILKPLVEFLESILQ